MFSNHHWFWHYSLHDHLHLAVFILTAGKCCDYCDFSNHRGFTIVCASYILVAAPCRTEFKAGGPLSIYLVPCIMLVRAPVRANKIVPALWEACLQGELESKIAPVTFPPVVNNHFVDLGHDSNLPTQKLILSLSHPIKRSPILLTFYTFFIFCQCNMQEEAFCCVERYWPTPL